MARVAVEPRLRAIFYLCIYIWATPFCVIVALITWVTSKLTRLVTYHKVQRLLEPQLRRKVLVTGAPLTKSLHVARVLGKVGHTVILADSEMFRWSGSTMSKFVTKFCPLPNLRYDGNSDKYVNALVDLAIKEDVDWFIPVSHTNTALADTLVGEKLKQIKPRIKTLAPPSTELAQVLDDKVLFLKECQKYGVPIPENHHITDLSDLEQLCKEGKFNDKYFFLKPLSPYSRDRLNFSRIPCDLNHLETFMEHYKSSIENKHPFLACQFIKGREFACNVICKNGKVFSIQVCKSSAVQIDFDVTSHPSIRFWTQQIVEKLNLSGCICFDFIEDDNDGRVYCIECNPRLHSNIVSYHGDAKLESAFRVALEGSDAVDGKTQFPIEPCPDSAHVYWLYNEIGHCLQGSKPLPEFFGCIFSGRDAVFDTDDPIPFVFCNSVQVIYQLIRLVVSGDRWSYVNACLGQLRQI